MTFRQEYESYRERARNDVVCTKRPNRSNYHRDVASYGTVRSFSQHRGVKQSKNDMKKFNLAQVSHNGTMCGQKPSELHFDVRGTTRSWTLLQLQCANYLNYHDTHVRGPTAASHGEGAHVATKKLPIIGYSRQTLHPLSSASTAPYNAPMHGTTSTASEENTKRGGNPLQIKIACTCGHIPNREMRSWTMHISNQTRAANINTLAGSLMQQ